MMWVIASCGPQQGDSSSTGVFDGGAGPAPAPVAVDLPDTTGASVWQYLEASDYRDTWSAWPGKGMLYEGQEPHGMLLTTYLNRTAMQGLENKDGVMPYGAVVVKENYLPDTTLAAITVMFKVEDFNPRHNDWFFSKHQPTGEVQRDPDGLITLEGRVPACESCHAVQSANDYLYTGLVVADSSRLITPEE